jgi:hypothetical protein
LNLVAIEVSGANCTL